MTYYVSSGTLNLTKPKPKLCAQITEFQTHKQNSLCQSDTFCQNQYLWKLVSLLQANNSLQIQRNSTHRYQSSGSRIVPACHKLCASNVHQIGGKSPSSSSSRTTAEIIVTAAFHTYGCWWRTHHDQISHAAALLSPIKFNSYRTSLHHRHEYHDIRYTNFYHGC